MNLKNKIKSYGFWVSLAGAAVIALQAFGIDVDIPVISKILTGVAGFMVLLGIISSPEKGKDFIDTLSKLAEKDSLAEEETAEEEALEDSEDKE